MRAVGLSAVRTCYGAHGLPGEVFRASSFSVDVARFLCWGVLLAVFMSTFPSFGPWVVFRESYVFADRVFSVCTILWPFCVSFYFLRAILVGAILLFPSLHLRGVASSSNLRMVPSEASILRSVFGCFWVFPRWLAFCFCWFLLVMCGSLGFILPVFFPHCNCFGRWYFCIRCLRLRMLLLLSLLHLAFFRVRTQGCPADGLCSFLYSGVFSGFFCVWKRHVCSRYVRRNLAFRAAFPPPFSLPCSWYALLFLRHPSFSITCSIASGSRGSWAAGIPACSSGCLCGPLLVSCDGF